MVEDVPAKVVVVVVGLGFRFIESRRPINLERMAAKSASLSWTKAWSH